MSDPPYIEEGGCFLRPSASARTTLFTPTSYRLPKTLWAVFEGVAPIEKQSRGLHRFGQSPPVGLHNLLPLRHQHCTLRFFHALRETADNSDSRGENSRRVRTSLRIVSCDPGTVIDERVNKV